MDSHRHLMLAPDSALREDIATDIGIAILAEGGVAALTPKAVGDRLGCSRQAVHQWFGSQEPLRHVVATRFSVRWGRWIHARVHSGGVAGLLPVVDEPVGVESDRADVVCWCRAWLALAEHAPRDGRLADLVEGVKCQERQAVARQLAGEPGCDRVAMVHALVEGLRVGLCAAEPTLAPGRAVRILQAAAALHELA